MSVAKSTEVGKARPPKGSGAGNVFAHTHVQQARMTRQVETRLFCEEESTQEVWPGPGTGEGTQAAGSVNIDTKASAQMLLNTSLSLTKYLVRAHSACAFKEVVISEPHETSAKE